MSVDLKAGPLYVEAHLGYIFGKALESGVDGVVVVSEPIPKPNPNARPTWRSRCFGLRELGQAAAYCARRSDEGGNVFVRNSLLHTTIPAYKRGTADETGWITGMVADLDIAGPGHQPAADGLPLPPTVAEAEAIADGVLVPSYMLASGGGLYGFWRLTEPVDVRDPVTRTSIKKLSQAFQDSLVEVGRRTGFHVDSVGDASRVLRPAGVVNRKAGREPRAVIVHRGCMTGTDTYTVDYTLDQLRAACITPTRSEVARRPRITRPAGEATVWDVFAELYSLGDVLDGDRRFGPWEQVESDSTFDYWVRAGASTDYSIKQSRESGVVIVWSGVVAGELRVRPGDGLDLYGFACRLEGRDPKERAAEIMRSARAKRRAVV